MKRALRFFAGLWGRKTERVLFSSPGLAPDWDDTCRAQFRQFLGSPTGKTLLARMRAVAATVSARACADAFHTSHSAGTANGWNESILWLESLSRSSRVPEESGPDTGQTDSPPTGESVLAEIWSP
jgi:hypothetical protein